MSRRMKGFLLLFGPLPFLMLFQYFNAPERTLVTALIYVAGIGAGFGLGELFDRRIGWRNLPAAYQEFMLRFMPAYVAGSVAWQAVVGVIAGIILSFGLLVVGALVLAFAEAVNGLLTGR